MTSARYRLFRMWEKHRLEVRGLASGELPGWLLSRDEVTPSEVPVFVFHQARPEALEPALKFLVRNGYQTVTADELVDLGGRVPAGERLVLLAFDDSLASVRTVAYPLFREYGCRAVVFVVPGVIGDEAGPWPDLTDIRAGRASRPDLQQRVERQPFCTWGELAEMAASGVMDVQSHSLSHTRVPVSSRVLEFDHPGLDLWYGNFDLPVSVLDPGAERTRRPGAPLYLSAPRLSARPAFIERPEVTRALTDLVETRGGAAFFSTPGWRRDLRRELRRHPAGSRGRFETETETRAAMRREIVEAREILERRLPGRAVRHLAYPWMVGSEPADALATEAGMRATFYGPFLPRGETHLLRIRRLPESYMVRLPGRERSSVADFIRRRVDRPLRPWTGP